MIFRKNKAADGPQDESPEMRGRDGEPGKRGANALARRFLVDDEPDTIDLSTAAGFPAAESGPEPDTRVTGDAAEETAGPDRQGLLSRDPETGKFYVHPGTPDIPVFLDGEPVTAPTELRRGDRIETAGAGFEFLGPVNRP